MAQPCRALFRVREEMEGAVRALAENGVPARRIRVRRTRAWTDRVPEVPPMGPWRLHGLALGAIGGAVWVASGFSIIPPEVSGVPPLLRVLAAPVLGAGLGGLFGAAVGAVHRALSGRERAYVVEVEETGSPTLEPIEDVLLRHGGEPPRGWPGLRRSAG